MNLFANYILINADKKALLYNSIGCISINGAHAFQLCKWLEQQLANFPTREAIIDRAPNNMRGVMEKLLDKLINHSFVCNKVLLDQEKSKADLSFQHNLKVDELVNCVGRGKIHNTLIDKFPVTLSNNSSLLEEHRSIITLLNNRKFDYILLANKFNNHVAIIEGNQFLVVVNHLESLSQVLMLLDIHEKHSPYFSCSNIAIDLLYYDCFDKLLNFGNNDISKTGLPIKLVKKDDYQISSHKQPIINTEIISSKIVEINERKDIPVLAGDDEAIVYLNRLNDNLVRLVDPITGPLLSLTEREYKQIPQSVSECSVPIFTDNKYAKKIFNCFGISSRECRNQVVLDGLEYFFHKNRLIDIKAEYTFGWDHYEAVFRLIGQLVKNEYFDIENWSYRVINLKKTMYKNKDLLGYLLDSLEEANVSLDFGITVQHSPYGFFICTFKQLREIGISLREAVINLLNSILANTNIKNFGDNNIGIAYSREMINQLQQEKFISTCREKLKVNLYQLQSQRIDCLYMATLDGS